MSYLDHQQSLRQRAASGAAVIAIQAAVAIALVGGLTIRGLAPEETSRVVGVTVPIDPPPPQPTPTPSAVTPAQIPMAPQPPIALQPAAPTVEPLRPIEPTVDYVPLPPQPTPTFSSPPAPQPSPSFAPKRPVPLGNAGGWITTEDYPAGPLRRGIEGTAGYRLVIGSDGKVTACELTRSSGNTQLDQATCRFITRRARFSPATDATGATVVGTFTGTVEWRIPD